MTKPHSDDADPKPGELEGDSAAVPTQADAATDQDTAEAADTVKSDDAESEREAEAVEPAKPKRRIGRLRAGGRIRKDAPASESADEDETVESEAKEPSDSDESSDREVDEAGASDDTDTEETAAPAERIKLLQRISWSRVLVYGVLPGLALLLAAAAGYLKWQDSSARVSQLARIESVAAAKDSTIALLSYKSDTVEKDLDAAKSRLTGAFKESYSQLIKDVVIPGAKKEHISTTATVPAAASVSATPNHAVALLFVNQSAVVDKSQPTDTTSSVRVTVDKVDGRWLISGFDPV